jgi:23S rRNA pseudouridine955/2504/2580 synthase
MTKIITNKNDENKRIDNFIKKLFPELTLPHIYKLFRNKDVKVNGKRIDIKYKINAGDVVEIFYKPTVIVKNQEFLNAHNDLNVVYEDNNILLLNKPIGLVVHEDNKHTIDTLSNRIKKYLYDKKE